MTAAAPAWRPPELKQTTERAQAQNSAAPPHTFFFLSLCLLLCHIKLVPPSVYDLAILQVFLVDDRHNNLGAPAVGFLRPYRIFQLFRFLWIFFLLGIFAHGHRRRR